MGMRAWALAAVTMLVSTITMAGGDATPPPVASEPLALDRQEVIDLVRGKTVDCRKENDGSLCWNYMSDDGVVKRLMAEDGARKDGVWFVDDQDRLCILWKGKIKPLCFLVYEQDDGTYNLIKGGRHITTLLGVEDGNTKGL
jgi:hypothetical protein